MDDLIPFNPTARETEDKSQQKRTWFIRGTLAALLVLAGFLLSIFVVQRWLLPAESAQGNGQAARSQEPVVVFVPTREATPSDTNTSILGLQDTATPTAGGPEEEPDHPPLPESAKLAPHPLLAAEGLEEAFNRVPEEHVPTLDGREILTDSTDSELSEMASAADVEADPQYALWPAREKAVPYTVQPGDNITILANRFGLSANTLIWANGDSDLLDVGDPLLIPPLNGVLHTVEEGDTLTEIAEQYGVEADLIAWFPGNEMEDVSDPLKTGNRVMVPGGVKPSPPEPSSPPPSAPRAASRRGGQSYFYWPTGGVITQSYHPHHRGIDIAAPMNTPIFAAQRGEVVRSGWDNTGYGYMILINHHNGWYTRYAHLRNMYVERGDWVEAQDLIGLMGSTGRSTGPHLHFEIITRGYGYNPFDYLP